MFVQVLPIQKLSDFGLSLIFDDNVRFDGDVLYDE